MRTSHTTDDPASKDALCDCRVPATCSVCHEEPPSVDQRSSALVCTLPSRGLCSHAMATGCEAASIVAPDCGAVRLGAAGAHWATTHAVSALHWLHPSALPARAR